MGNLDYILYIDSMWQKLDIQRYVFAEFIDGAAKQLQIMSNLKLFSRFSAAMRHHAEKV